jgi:hypothetical protein
MNYYGVRYSRSYKCLYKTGCHSDDLMTVYYTSSKIVKQFINMFGIPDIVQIRKTFKNAEDAIMWESKVLQRLKVVSKSNWLNANDTKAVRRGSGWHHSDITKAKISSVNKLQKRVLSTDHKRRISIANKGKVLSLYTKIKIKKAQLGVKKSIKATINNGLAHRKPIYIYSKEQDKIYVWETTNTFKEDTGFTNNYLKQMKFGGFIIKRKTKRVRHNFNIGDTLTMVNIHQDIQSDV